VKEIDAFSIYEALAFGITFIQKPVDKDNM
jgi:hypothetical protein